MSTETYLVRLKPHDPRRGFVLRRYMLKGIKFQDTHGWYKVPKDIADYLRGVRQVASDPHSPLAFDVCSESEAQAIEVKESEAADPRKSATDDIQLSMPREEKPGTKRDDRGRNRSR